MNKTRQIFTLFAVIVIEGYIVLSAELLAIRQTLPYVGSGTDTVSIIIAAVLMPLAFGYYAGGNFKAGFQNGKYRSVRKKLIMNIMISMGFLFFGLSYAFLSLFFVFLIKSGIDNRIILTTIYSLLFLVTPVYLLGQTIPLISNYFSKENLAQITGRMLFFSTLGSFMGAVFSTLVLMSTIGVHNTAGFLFILLALLVFLLSKRKISEMTIISFLVMGFALNINSTSIMKSFNIVENNKYNSIAFYENDNMRFMALNNNTSSAYADDGRKYPYIELLEKLAIAPILSANPPKNILVIGAGGFTFGLEDTVNHYDFVDIDASLKKIAEEHLLKQKLTDNKIFHAVPIRAYLAKSGKKYDVILLDAFQSGASIPEHLITQEFFVQIKQHLNERGIVLYNAVTSPNFTTTFSRALDNTFSSVFPHSLRIVMENKYNLWEKQHEKTDNVIYIYTDRPEANGRPIYTDNKNRSFLDQPT